MKKNFILFVLVLLVFFNGCEKKELEDTVNMVANLDVQIVADYGKELVVPNPESLEKDVTIVMRYIPNFEKYEAYDEMDKCYKSCEVDLSFLGFKNRMKILAFQIGTVTGYTSEYTNIVYDIPNEYLGHAEQLLIFIKF